MKVTINIQEQAALINDALAGKYQAVTWRQFGAVDPDLNYVWWSTTTASGPISLNMARNSDPRIQAALITGRTSADPATRVKAYQKVNQYLAEDIPYLYGDRSTWAVAAKPNVQNFNNPMTPRAPRPRASTRASSGRRRSGCPDRRRAFSASRRRRGTRHASG